MKRAESRNGDRDITKLKCFKCDRVILEIKSSRYEKNNNHESLFLTQYHQNMGEARNARRKGQKYNHDDILHYHHIMLKIYSWA